MRLTPREMCIRLQPKAALSPKHNLVVQYLRGGRGIKYCRCRNVLCKRPPPTCCPIHLWQQWQLHTGALQQGWPMWLSILGGPTPVVNSLTTTTTGIFMSCTSAGCVELWVFPPASCLQWPKMGFPETVGRDIITHSLRSALQRLQDLLRLHL